MNDVGCPQLVLSYLSYGYDPFLPTVRLDVGLLCSMGELMGLVGRESCSVPKGEDTQKVCSQWVGTG